MGYICFKDTLIAFLFHGVYYHLWYLLTSLYAFPLLYFLLQHIRRIHLSFIIGILWIYRCLTHSYAWLNLDGSLYSLMVDKIPSIFLAIFCAIPLLFIGTLFKDSRNHDFSTNIYLSAIISFLLCTIEASMLHFWTPNTDKYAYLISTPFFAYFTLRSLIFMPQIQISSKIAYILRDSSLIIYCLHPLIILLCSITNISNRIFLWLTTTILTVLLAFLWVQNKAHLKKWVNHANTATLQ